MTTSSSNDSPNLLFDGEDVLPGFDKFINNLEQYCSTEDVLQIPLLPESLRIVGQPVCASKVRSRNEYLPPATRRDPLKSQNPTYTGPAIYIPRNYHDIAGQYYVGVSLATLEHEKTGCRYIHPYELESIDCKEQNDEKNNIVWFPIGSEYSNGIKSFTDLRILKRTENELVKSLPLRPFHGSNTNLLNNPNEKSISPRNIVPEYSLKKAQLVFFIGQKQNSNEEFPSIIDSQLIIFSDEINLFSKQGTTDNDKSTKISTTTNQSPSRDCRWFKYAPRTGYTEGNEEILVYFTKKLDEKNYGNLEVKFESDTANGLWSESVLDLEVYNQLVSFKTPCISFPINEPLFVKIIFKQSDTIIEQLNYTYLIKSQCFTCQTKAVNAPHRILQTPHRQRTRRTPDDMVASSPQGFETDAVVPIPENRPIFRQSKSEPESTLSNSASRSSINTNEDESPVGKILNDSIVTLFTDNNYQPLLRSCRLFVKKHPELIHEAISKNYCDLISKFIPVAGVELLKHENQLGETVLLHTTRLNQIDCVKTILERKNSSQLLESENKKGQNIFHILALNYNSEEMIYLFINYLLENSIDIREKFDGVDEDDFTPLQLAIVKNNLAVTRIYLEYFDKYIRKTSDPIGDNLIHLAVRYSDLTMLKYLLDEEELTELGNQSNTVMTPIELARSLNHNEMLEYLQEKYPPPEIDEDQSSDSD